jgi:riboflavin synthase
MFTGLTETTGQIVSIEGDSLKRFTIASALPVAEIAIGDSIALDGCCLTVVQKVSGGLVFEAMTETLQRTTLGGLQPGSTINLERALRLSDRLGGHWVQGHVDGVGAVLAIEQNGGAVYVTVGVPDSLLKFCAPQGSIAINGVSLTIAAAVQNTLTVALIPHTLQVTTLGLLQVGSRVNLEVDVIARYLARLAVYG